MQSRDPQHARGIDVSHHQGVIDWKLVKESGVSFAFLKATEGVSFEDPRFASNLINAKIQGIAVGAYHFFRASTVQGAMREAEFFITVIQKNGGFALFDLPPVNDVETANGVGKQTISLCARVWHEKVRGVSGINPILYTYPWFAEAFLHASLADIPLWLANYGVNAPKDRAGWTRWTFLQYSDNFTVPGIQGQVDMDEFEGTVRELLGQPLSVNDANKIIRLLSGAYGAVEGYADAQAELHRLANELRKASGQPEE